MTAPTPVVMLPGMDGTGALFGALVSTCPAAFEPIVLRYASDRCESSEELLTRIDRGLPAAPAILLAESFSGALAIRFAATHRSRVKALVLCNAFVHPPAPSIARFVPWSIVMRLRPSTRVIRQLLVGADASSALVDAVGSAISQVAPGVLAARMRAVLSEDARPFAASLDLPVLYLRGTEDAIVNGRAVRDVLNAIPTAQLAEIRGPHLLLQSRPEASWAVIQGFAG